VTVPAQTTSSIATSTAQHDGGLFELSFRDERYLPFEGAGAVSTWRLELPSQLRQFDYDSISDVVVHVSYTALDDGAFRQNVESALSAALAQHAATVGLHRLFSLRHDFPSVFHQLMHPSGAQAVTFELGPQHFPFFLAGRAIASGGLSVYLQPVGKDPVDTTGLAIKINGTATGPFSTLPKTNLRTADAAVSGPALKPWTVEVSAGKLEPDDVSDVLLLIRYTAPAA
jgi:Tc toxin complex TcA C-terminal TcB-binding domain